MAEKKLTIALMDAPYEKAATTTALRIVSAALKKAIHVNVFAYEGAVNLAMKDQAPHANPVKGTTVEQEEHPTTKQFVRSLLELGKSNPQLTWVNCGLCVDERGAINVVDGVKRGSPADFFKMAAESTNTLVIPTR
jgi:tRNA 2-thiouridine synthesizing protein D